MYYKNNEYIFATTRLNIETFEDLLGQRVLKYWELDKETGIKNNKINSL